MFKLIQNAWYTPIIAGPLSGDTATGIEGYDKAVGNLIDIIFAVLKGIVFIILCYELFKMWMAWRDRDSTEVKQCLIAVVACIIAFFLRELLRVIGIGV